MILKLYQRRLILVVLAFLAGACYLPRRAFIPASFIPSVTAPPDILSSFTLVPTASLTPLPSPTLFTTIIVETPLPVSTETTPTLPSKLGTVDYDVTYCTNQGVELKMDVYYPTKVTTAGAWPLVINIHGGRWVKGNKDLGDTLIYDKPALLEAGFLFVSVEFRRGGINYFPAMIEDIKCAVRYFRTYPELYNIDPTRIGAVGFSSGGHLAALLGLADASAGWDEGQYLDQSSSVQAVVDYYGITDLSKPDFLVDPLNQIPEAFGTADLSNPIFFQASVVNYISPDDSGTAFLIIHGEQDELVPYSQSEELYALLKEAGVPAQLLPVVNAKHGLLPVGGDPIIPSRDEITQQVVDFFTAQLMNK